MLILKVILGSGAGDNENDISPNQVSSLATVLLHYSLLTKILYFINVFFNRLHKEK